MTNKQAYASINGEEQNKMSENRQSVPTPEEVAKSISDRLVARRTAGEATPEQIENAKSVIGRVQGLINEHNQQYPNSEPVTKIEATGIWTYDKPKGHKYEQKNSRGFRVDAHSKVEIAVTEDGVALTETTREKTHLRGYSGPTGDGSTSQRLTIRERLLFIDNDGLTVFGEFVQSPKHGEGSVHDDGELVESVLRESPEGERVPFIASEQEFAQKVLASFEPQQEAVA